MQYREIERKSRVQLDKHFAFNIKDKIVNTKRMRLLQEKWVTYLNLSHVLRI